MTTHSIPTAPVPHGYVTLRAFLDNGGDLGAVADNIDFIHPLTYGVMAHGREGAGPGAVSMLEKLATFDEPTFPTTHPAFGNASEHERARTYYELYRNAMWTLEALSSDEMVVRTRSALPPDVLAEAMAEAEQDLDGDLRPFAFRVEQVGDYVCAMTGVPCSGVGIVLEPRGYVADVLADTGLAFVFSPAAVMATLADQLRAAGVDLAPGAAGGVH